MRGQLALEVGRLPLKLQPVVAAPIHTASNCNCYPKPDSFDNRMITAVRRQATKQVLRNHHHYRRTLPF